MGFGVAGAFGHWLAGRFVDQAPAAPAAMEFAVAMPFAPSVATMPVLLARARVVWGTPRTASFRARQTRLVRAVLEAPACAAPVNRPQHRCGGGLFQVQRHSPYEGPQAKKRIYRHKRAPPDLTACTAFLPHRF